MSVTLTLVPTNPIISKGCQVVFSLTGGGNYVRVWCVYAPEGSSLREQLDRIGSTTARVEVFANEVTIDSNPWLFKPDKPGRYGLVAQEYTRGASSYGGGYAGDPAGFSTETKVGGETTLAIDFGTRLTATLGVAPDTATLVLYVFGDNVLATTFALHGENTPDIIDAKTSKARNAAVQNRSRAQAFAGQTATAIRGVMGTVVSNMVNQISGHVTNTTSSVHATGSDTGDVPNAAYLFLDATTSNETIVAAVKDLVTKVGYHMNTDKALKLPFTSSGPGSGDWHTHSSTVVVDWADHLLVSAPSTFEDAYKAAADVWRAYSGHRVNTDVHGSADNTYNLAALPPLCDLHRAFLSVLAQPSPPLSPAENPGAQVLIGGAGMKES